MTLAIGSLPTDWMVGQWVTLPVMITGGSPVHNVTVELVGDGFPAWYYVVPDARAAGLYAAGPLRRAGRFELTARAVDEMGCEIANGVRVYVTVR